MGTQKPSIPKGTRDFSPLEMSRRTYIFDTIKNVFQLYGFSPIETPAMENLSTLTGKYGEEGDKLIFKILNSGDFLADLNIEELKNKNYKQITSDIAEKALRYDLTVPFARYVVQHQNEITFPFKRYQIQPVWRADRPQKGRYREFYQCDADVIGSTSLMNEVELVQIIDEVFKKLELRDGFAPRIKVNNRKILSGIADLIGEADKMIKITTAIDKLDKIGLEKVNEELKASGISESAIQKLQPLIELKGSSKEKLQKIKHLLINSEIGSKGIEELEYVLDYAEKLKINNIEFDVTLARGLNYYTGIIIEVKAYKNNLPMEIGSICAGGRYDDLTGIFGLPNVSGVGISFGIDRIYDVRQELGLQLFQDQYIKNYVLIINFGQEEEEHSLKMILPKIRSVGLIAEIYPSAEKIKKQLKYANNKGARYVLFVGRDEINKKEYTLKDMQSGEEKKLPIHEIIEKLKS